MPPPPPPHLQIINPSYYRPEDVSFTSFPRLPADLRIAIWHASLERHRLLEVEIAPPPEDKRTQSGSGRRPYQTKNALGKPVSGRDYEIIVHGLQIHSKLLRVTREARRAALSFYRVHLPCSFQRYPDEYERKVEAMLYFNPELDFLDLKGQVSDVVAFSHDVHANDPRNVGLVNVALGPNTLTKLRYFGDEITEPPAQAAFIAFLSRVREVIWVAHSLLGRQILPYHGFDDDKIGVRFNHSMPIMGHTPRFELVKRDPRPIGPELKYVLTASSDPRSRRVQWRELLEMWQAHPAQPARERILFAYRASPRSGLIWDVATAHLSLKEEEEGWLRTQKLRRASVRRFAKKDPPIEGPEELSKAVRPAIGFWLFPVEAAGDMVGYNARMKKVTDLSAYWPELALACLT
ncbi:hypothetical protein jhhlp_005431 [Lomentospora prolificans]|uniref:2EXR domain-containing protein n=1 Tax=Lomentospora prolificans TaxID=41688 RepID=A0A2N3N6U2_9PEZI|nr:hypothetical protein jhhlp_005431 [Lomentospora prolificans]